MLILLRKNFIIGGVIMPSIPELRKKYSTMSLAQKKQFCQSLQKSVEGKKTPENTKFLNECITI
jgi:formylmethanofuran:tetrahydromethanopterin formyltransferase